ncbi:hypothetical protein KGF54_001460 [Candida jiufengensis]|uniref:uncharacterized protein n=1 Tax=Candida jiufengensis TaxID=497108 RepID=UPI002224EEF5|nr:uncharacterized protein KGF54_001460 [Candida jiufengensis]KAI5954899.1 hypothetical protein KGF54_001460 [Candida jiufengensis]
MSDGYIVTLKDSCSDSTANEIKQKIESAGGKIKDEFSLIKGFSVSLPSDHISTLESHPEVANVEKDGEVKTQ